MEDFLGFLDMRTIIFTMVVTNLVCALVMLLLWRQNYKRLDGLMYWVANFTLQTITVILIVLRGHIPDWVSIDVANTLSIIGIYLGYRGLEKFFHLKSFQWLNYAILILYPVLITWHTYVHPDLAIRNLYIGIFSFWFCFQCVWLLFFRVKRSMLPMTLLVGVVFILYCAVDITRVFNYFMIKHTVINYFEAGSFEAFVILSYKILLIILTFGLALMFNKRLLVDIALEEEKFSKAFHTSPYAIVLSHMNDGHIIEINETFQQYSGFTSQEIVGQTAHVLSFWENPKDRAFMLNELANKREVRDMEFRFRK
jgi:PAS domain-containing protein